MVVGWACLQEDGLGTDWMVEEFVCFVRCHTAGVLHRKGVLAKRWEDELEKYDN